MSASTHWARVREILERVLDVPADERPSHLHEACGGDAALEREVAELIAAEGDADAVLPPTDALPRWLDEHVAGALVGARIGSCRIVGLLGAGGMGTVYEAEQDHPRRRVALKVLQPAPAGDVALRRFEIEAELLASLRHPGVAQVYEAGVHEHRSGGQTVRVPYFVMEAVEGARDLAAYAAAERLSAEERLSLFVDVCDAVHHAHRRGLVHRDLKPANLLVDVHGRVKVIDFGVAKVMGGAETADVAGTLRYMSPEQRAGGPAAVDLRGDVWALGVVLAELLPDLPPEVRWIARKATEHEPARRYVDAGELGEDVRRFLRHEPVRAAPGGALYRMRKLARRHRLKAAAGALALAGAVTGVVGLALALHAAERERASAEAKANEIAALAAAAERQRASAEAKAAEIAAVVEFMQGMLVASQPWHAGGDVTVREVLDQAAQRIEGEFADRPGVGAALHETVGWLLRGLGRPREAEPHLRRAVELMTGQPTTRPRELIIAEHRLALVESDLGHPDDAEARLATVIPLAEEHLGADHDTTLAVQDLRAICLSALGRLDEAAALLERVLRASEARFGGSSKKVIAHRNNLATVLSKLGRLAEAAEHAEASEQAMRLEWGVQHPDTQVTMQNRAALLSMLGQHEQSEELTREVLALRREIYGDRHPHTLMSRYWLGRALLGQRKYDAAREVLALALPQARAVLGAEHVHALNTASALAAALVGCGRNDEARALMGGVLEQTAQRTDPAGVNARQNAQRVLDEATREPTQKASGSRPAGK